LLEEEVGREGRLGAGSQEGDCKDQAEEQGTKQCEDQEGAAN